MDVKPMIVREYLESLTENNELDVIFPMLLESKGYVILSRPKEYKGFPQYGKDVVAVGKDFESGVLKRFYFEIKGGNDRHITTSTYNKNDGIRESIREAKDKKFESDYPNFDNLPLEIILVHNGEIKPNISETFNGFIENEFPKGGKITFSRWGISSLVKYFSEYLFGVYLLPDKETIRLFNRVIVNLNVNDGVSLDFKKLLDLLFSKNEWRKSSRGMLARKWKMLFESIKLISFIVYTEAKENNNLDISKRYLTHLVLRYWFWILKNNLEKDKRVTKYFDQIFSFYFEVLGMYFSRNMSIASIKDGLYSENSGRYEEVGYTYRTFDFLQFFCFALNVDKHLNVNFDSNNSKQWLVKFINANNVSSRPLIDIHSIPIFDIIKLLIEFDEIDSAKNYLLEVLGYLKIGKETYGRLPDTNNNIESFIKLSLTGEKPVYYSDETSPLLTLLVELLAILNLELAYEDIKKFVNENDIQLGVFVPHHGINSISKQLIEDKENDLEEQLFSKSVNDGYQSGLDLSKVNYETYDMKDKLDFEKFKKKIEDRKNEFEYKYRTDEAGYPFLRDLAHIYFRTPYFPDKWRSIMLN